jgi:drug/metabolite transporter (DMT)-like permease
MIFYYALTKIPATRVISFTYLQPVLATILAILLLGERVTQNLLIGGTLVLLGVILATRTGRLYDFLGGFALEETTVIELDLRGRR